MFNSSASVAEQLATVDGFGRVILNQMQQGYHATNYDSTQTSYDTFGREYLSWGLSHYRHADWLGSSRLESSTTHAILQDTAYAPFGEPYYNSPASETAFEYLVRDQFAASCKKLYVGLEMATSGIP